MPKKKKAASKGKAPKYPFVDGVSFKAKSRGVTRRINGMVDFAVRPEHTVKASCSCGGENENCFRCAGTGFYDKVIAPGAVTEVSPTVVSTRPLAGFASDPRGSQYGIRAQGRFDSTPHHDNFDDESSA